MKAKILMGIATLAIIAVGVTQLKESDPLYEEVDHEELDERLSMLGSSELDEMAHAGEEVLKFQKSVSQFTHACHFKRVHYPKGDVFYKGSQYYFHKHREKEHGHFHLFLREEAFPEEISPAREKDFAHLVAIEVDTHGQPRSLFATNRWVTGEGEHTSDEISKMLDRFSIEGDSPSRELNQWITAMVRLFKPQIVDLLNKSESNGEVKASLPISVEKQISSIHRYRH